MKQKTINRLSSNKWYHATTYDNWLSICRLGVKAEYNIDTSNDLDFGYGFYLTIDGNRAENFISKLAETGTIDGKRTAIIEFEFIPISWFQNEIYKTKIFEENDDDFAEFVFSNRHDNISGINQHPFDAIYGVMSDSYPTKLLIDYDLGRITKQEVLDGIKKGNSMKQLSLHIQALCDIIRPSRAYLFNTITKEKEELNINEYHTKCKVY